MYFCVGWPKFIESRSPSRADYVICNRDRSLFAVVCCDVLSVWFVRPCVEITRYRRSEECISTYGINCVAEWCPDSSMIAVATVSKCLMFYSVEVDDTVKGLYEQFDSKVAGLKRESAELFLKEKIPPLSLAVTKVLDLSGNIRSIVCIRDELMAAGDDGHIWRIRWDGILQEEFSLHVSDIPFSADQQTKGVYLKDSELCVNRLEYSPLIGGFSAVLSNGRASFLTASTLKFNPGKVVGIVVQDILDATCTAVNHRYRLIAYGLKSAEGVVVSFDDLTGALQVTHRLVLSSKDFPDAASAVGFVSNLKWSPDGGVLAMTWEKGGLAIWSVFGALILCSLGWDYGVADVMKGVIKVKSLEWGPEGYNLWMVCENSCQFWNNQVFKLQHETAVGILQFAKSALTVNSAMAGHEYIFLQAEDRLFVSVGSQIQSDSVFSTNFEDETDAEDHFLNPVQPDQMIVGNKQWIVVPIPYSYLGSNWPVRYAAVDSENHNMVIAGRSGLAHYSLIQKRWKLFGSETQEKDFVVMGGLLWWEDQIVLGCFNLQELRDEVRIYSRETKLDNKFVYSVHMASQVLQLSSLNDKLLCFCADSHLTLFQLHWKNSHTNRSISATCLQELDVSNIVFHPACVISALLTSVCSETGHCHPKAEENILLNVCGRLLLLQKEPLYEQVDADNNNQAVYSYGAPTVLASSVENVWICGQHLKNTHLTEALWIACGARGMRVWLPLYPCDGEKHRAHNFMSKRIMLPIDLSIYPLAVLFEDAVIIGAESEAILSTFSTFGKQPFCMITRTFCFAHKVYYSLAACTLYISLSFLVGGLSIPVNLALCLQLFTVVLKAHKSYQSQVYLHHILRQLLKRNLGYHAWEIAQSCSSLPYFPHSLELLLHEVLEEEATSSEPIPDALLPRVIDFIEEFPVFLQTVVQCTRKTELALWPYLFAAVGNPKSLFQACLLHGELETAASYVIILQNLEPPAVSQHYATTLLNSALEAGNFQLANELVRFLKAISDTELPPRSVGMLGKYVFPQITPPVTPTEEDLSFVLGTVSLTRGRSQSTGVASKFSHVHSELTSKIPQHEISRTVGEYQSSKQRKMELHDTSVPEKFFVEARILSHAQKLLSDGKLSDLGRLAAHMDFELVAFFSKEKNGAACITDFVKSLCSLHHDFKCPYPAEVSRIELPPRKLPAPDASLCSHSMSTGSCSLPDHQAFSNSISNVSECNKDKVSLIASLETPVSDFQLLLKGKKEEIAPFDMSETSSTWAEESHATVDDDFWINQLFCESDHGDDHSCGRFVTSSEVKLRYLQHLLIEAGCLDWGVVISVILFDAARIIQIFSDAKRPEETSHTFKRLQQGIEAIRKWAENECNGYLPFVLAVQNQVLKTENLPSLPCLVPRTSSADLHSGVKCECASSAELPKCDKVSSHDASSQNLDVTNSLTENLQQPSECVIC